MSVVGLLTHWNDDMQAGLDGHRVAITGAVKGSTSCSLLRPGYASVTLSNLKAASPVYASTAPRDLSGVSSAVPVYVYSTNEPVDPILGLGLVKPGSADICCVILAGDLVCYKKQPRQIGTVDKILWPDGDALQHVGLYSNVRLQIAPHAGAAASTRHRKPQEVPLAALVSTACMLSEADYCKCFPGEAAYAAYACPAVTCLRTEVSSPKQQVSSQAAGATPSWRRLEVLVQCLGPDQQVQSAICR